LYDGLAALDLDASIRLEFLVLLTHDRAVPNFIPAFALAKPLASVKPHHDIGPPPKALRRGRSSGGGRGSRGGARGRGDVGRGARGRGGRHRGRGRGVMLPHPPMVKPPMLQTATRQYQRRASKQMRVWVRMRLRLS
jgi:hypothetical protein